jgi:hypothetical protein
MKTGEYCEGMEWTIELDETFQKDSRYPSNVCEHAIVVEADVPQYREDGSCWAKMTTYRVPRLVRAFNEAGHNSTAVCVDCILQAVAHPETGEKS